MSYTKKYKQYKSTNKKRSARYERTPRRAHMTRKAHAKNTSRKIKKHYGGNLDVHAEYNILPSTDKTTIQTDLDCFIEDCVEPLKKNSLEMKRNVVWSDMSDTCKNTLMMMNLFRPHCEDFIKIVKIREMLGLPLTDYISNGTRLNNLLFILKPFNSMIFGDLYRTMHTENRKYLDAYVKKLYDAGKPKIVFKQGDLVDINSDGKWLRGKVIAVNPKGYFSAPTYDIEYDDDKTKMFGLPTESLRLVDVMLKKGDRIQGNYQDTGMWNFGTITNVTKTPLPASTTYNIQYDGGFQTRTLFNIDEQSLLPDNSGKIRSIGDEVEYKQISGNKTKGKIDKVIESFNITYDIQYDNGNTETNVPADRIHYNNVDINAILKRGDLVEGNFQDKGKWFPAKITNVDGNKYDIEYNNDETESNVSRERLRLIMDINYVQLKELLTDINPPYFYYLVEPRLNKDKTPDKIQDDIRQTLLDLHKIISPDELCDLLKKYCSIPYYIDPSKFDAFKKISLKNTLVLNATIEDVKPAVDLIKNKYKPFNRTWDLVGNFETNTISSSDMILSESELVVAVEKLKEFLTSSSIIMINSDKKKVDLTTKPDVQLRTFINSFGDTIKDNSNMNDVAIITEIQRTKNISDLFKKNTDLSLLKEIISISFELQSTRLKHILSTNGPFNPPPAPLNSDLDHIYGLFATYITNSSKNLTLTTLSLDNLDFMYSAPMATGSKLPTLAGGAKTNVFRNPFKKTEQDRLIQFENVYKEYLTLDSPSDEDQNKYLQIIKDLIDKYPYIVTTYSLSLDGKEHQPFIFFVIDNWKDDIFSNSIISYLLQKDTKILSQQNSEDETAIEYVFNFIDPENPKLQSNLIGDRKDYYIQKAEDRLKLIRKLTEDPNSNIEYAKQNNSGNTLLMSIIAPTSYYERDEIAIFLIDGEAKQRTNNFNIKNPLIGQETALMMASENGYTNIVNKLLEVGADFNIKNEFNNTALMLASKNGHIDVVTTLIDKGAELNLQDAITGNTALMMGIEGGHADVATALIDKDANVNIKNKTNNTALMLASKNGQIDVVTTLIDKGSELNLQDAITGNTALMMAIEGGHTDVANALIDKGADVNLQNKTNNTALMFASKNGQLNVVNRIIDKGVDLNLQNNLGNTALMMASFSGNREVATLLIEKGANFNVKNNLGNTALIVSIRGKKTNVAKLLIEKGADVNSTNQTGDTALMFASKNGEIDVVTTLIEKGANVNVQNNLGYTALMMASFSGNIEMAKNLIEKGADVNAKNNINGYTALMLAIRGKHTNVAKLLIEKGADVNLQNKTGDTALNIARDIKTSDKDLLVGLGMDVDANVDVDVDVDTNDEISTSDADLITNDNSEVISREFSEGFKSATISAILEFIDTHISNFKSYFKTDYENMKTNGNFRPSYWQIINLPENNIQQLSITRQSFQENTDYSMSICVEITTYQKITTDNTKITTHFLMLMLLPNQVSPTNNKSLDNFFIEYPDGLYSNVMKFILQDMTDQYKTSVVAPI